MTTTTLPDLPTLANMGELTAVTLYRAEIAQLPLLLRETAQHVIERARQGEAAAREELLLGCVRYAWMKAWSIYRTRRPQHTDVLDLVGVAHLAMIEALDRALASAAPVGYLVGVAAREIQRECTYHAPLIQKPEQTLAKLAKVDPHPATVESLDAPLSHRKGSPSPHERIPAPVPVEISHEYALHRRFAPLYAAVKRLPPRQQAVIIRHYGFFGQPAETTAEIGLTEHILPRTVSNHGFLARQHLREWLADELAEMITPKPLPAE
ncbi:MAG: hypothetical protein ABI413_14730 [Ktedonobacteraceae bacterium]